MKYICKSCGYKVEEDEKIMGYCPRCGRDSLVENNPLIKYSIVVPTLNCDTEVEKLLASMKKENIHKKRDVEVIFIDAASSDLTQEIIYKSNFAKKYVYYGVTKGFARLKGVYKAKGDIIINLDSDVEITKGWFDAVKRATKYNNIVAGYSPHPKRGYIPRVPIWVKGQDVTWPFCNIAHKKSVFEDVGLIRDTELSEDIDFNYRCIKKGYTIAYEPKMKVYHNHTQNKKEFIKQSFLYGRCRYQLKKRYPELLQKQQSSIKNFFRLGFGGLGYIREMVMPSE